MTRSRCQDQRYYTQNAGRFYTPDPAGMKAVDLTNPTSWNMYAYVNNDPVNFYDPSGTAEQCPPGTHVVYTGGASTGQCVSDGGIGTPGSGRGRMLPVPRNPEKIPFSPGANGGAAGPYVCPGVPTLPGSDAAATIQQNVSTADNYFWQAMQVDPNAAMMDLFGFLTAQFWKNGQWDYKHTYTPGTPAYAQAMIFGNFDFGAVMASLGFSYSFTQNAAGVAQIGICISGGACGTGVPVFQYPFGDQVTDAADVQKGYDFEKAKQAGCVTPVRQSQ